MRGCSASRYCRRERHARSTVSYSEGVCERGRAREPRTSEPSGRISVDVQKSKPDPKSPQRGAGSASAFTWRCSIRRCRSINDWDFARGGSTASTTSWSGRRIPRHDRFPERGAFSSRLRESPRRRKRSCGTGSLTTFIDDAYEVILGGFPILSVPDHRELQAGTLRALIRKAGVTVGVSAISSWVCAFPWDTGQAGAES